MPLQQNIWNNDNLVKVLKENGIVVMPTDTLYGIVGRAEDRKTVERIYKIRKRNPEKPCIVLIGDLSELKKFNINLTEMQKNEIAKFTQPTSFIVDCIDEKFFYLHRGTHTLAFRIPKNEELLFLLAEVGPLIVPSANLEALPPSETISEARSYFGNQVDLYIDGGEIKGIASKVIRLNEDGAVDVLRD
ncbi:threonylcarbamoyl-AMP synthase [Candidatus Nomurabacteria bacterium RIFCSPHIGHO2_01_FULL_40_12]|uniref:L-threonylcarbamoyladenylate synthase n=1 Tax=Candidatus Nomurabacteria bacterium RIFCSPHIGHO2_01_FULL_40_12 TaxID=1801737 RepID=A0A1F6UZK0_9BACT|nr:MAG: threonylcarbamoyl-AMP synthase [Candidatus Nomurabacteria bacterium RIFCSPHIGHO2_01_FULL_40_12]